MTPSLEFMQLANKRLQTLIKDELAPKVLAAHGQIEHQLKDDKSVVTEMDLFVEGRLKEVFAELDPAIGFGGEETGVDYNQETFWLVDPIDGTESFVRGLPFFTTMIALIHKGEAIMAVIYNYMLDDYYLAIKGQGAICNGEPIQVSDRTLDRAFVTFGGLTRGHKGSSEELRILVRGMPKMHASGYEFSNIARGALEGNICLHRKGHPWDHAPGTLLIIEAGGRVENIDAPGFDYLNSKFVAANPVVFDKLMSFIRERLTD